MVGYMTLQAQLEADFSRARRRALLRKVRIRLRREKTWDGLLCFDEIKMISWAAGGRIDRGMRTVLVSQIGGSIGRCTEFDGEFMPATASVKQRWKHIDRAFHRGGVLPPVNLYKVGSFYFVLDGHHRVSVAAYHGVKWIDANVTEFNSGSGLPKRRSRPDRAIQMRRPEDVRDDGYPACKADRDELLREVELKSPSSSIPDSQQAVCRPEISSAMGDIETRWMVR